MASALLLPQCSLPFSNLASGSLPSRPGPCKSSASSTRSPSSTTSLRPSLQIPDRLRREIDSFDPKIPLDEAHTPPSSWYTDPLFLDIEFDRVFYRGWQAVGYVEQVASAHDFFTGRLGSLQFVITRDTNGHLRAFHNVCRHHASLIATACGRKSCFVCPYHGWTYGLDGGLLKATQISGIKNFHLHELGLLPINLATWGPFLLLNFNQQLEDEESSGESVGKDWLGSCSEILIAGGVDHSLKHVCRREYNINCNWKVFCDNYLDGGYHVPYAHGALAAGLELETYSTMVYERVSIQRCESMQIERGDDFDRLGSKALYAFIYPNFMINSCRYGPWMDTNLVVPTGPSKCQVIFDYFLESGSKEGETFIRRSLEESERVQMEDITLCEGVQKGLESQACFRGRYAPTREKAMHHFHCFLHENFTAD
ncbi:choline monooxygenase, chloroplastic isoform X2 [Nymphaea colorata]|uniref:choline monooxygenase, chloroplastic isoform X2 n=1 Tax=Nymphaea colorata TaxID=210225 RepID=UPI00129D6F03|nr:choline monooxygenase, chloroplastic isoform X2 [Nymphaea colorata]